MNLYINQSFELDEKLSILPYAQNGYFVTRKIDK